MKIEFEGRYDAIDCPFCGGHNLHIDYVETFDGRRLNPLPFNDDGLLVHHTCETCDNRPRLQYHFHKGSVYMSWGSK
jgi:hypothetical protein